MFQEFPKSLHMKGEWDGESVIVANAEEESAMRAKGFRMLTEPQKESEVKPTRKRKE